MVLMDTDMLFCVKKHHKQTDIFHRPYILLFFYHIC